MVETLSARADIPKPAVYLIENDAPNAFATGRSPEKGAVAVTTGLLRLLDRDEVAGVIAHELAHIRHRDTLISSIVATIAGVITMLANMAQWALLFGGLGGSSDDEDNGGRVFGSLIMIILAPIAALVIQLAISRSREYAADAGGAQILGDPLAAGRRAGEAGDYVAARADGSESGDIASVHRQSTARRAGGTVQHASLDAGARGAAAGANGDGTGGGVATQGANECEPIRS